MYFIIIHYIIFDGFLSVNITFLERGKTRYVVSLYVIVRLNFKNDKSPVKQFRADVQVK